MRGRNHDWRIDGILKTKLQGSNAQSIKTLQSQNRPLRTMRPQLSRLAALHGRLSQTLNADRPGSDPQHGLAHRLFYPLAYVDIGLLLLAPVASAGNRAIDHQIMTVDESRFIAGEEYHGMTNVFG